MRFPQELDDRWIIEVPIAPEYSFTTVQVLTGLSVTTLRKHCHDGHLEAYSRGHRSWITHDSLIQFLDSRALIAAKDDCVAPEYLEEPAAKNLNMPEVDDELTEFMKNNMGFLEEFRHDVSRD